jgi:acyl-CoA reductase-like NAD-dependent aldehyde dehydrogenase
MSEKKWSDEAVAEAVNAAYTAGQGSGGMRPDEREAALRKLLDAIETMDQKITPYGEREDGTILHYIVADSTWHRVLAAARNPSWFSSEPERKRVA